MLSSSLYNVIYGHVVIFANVRAETKLGKRRTYRGRRKMFLRSFFWFTNFFPIFSKDFSQTFSKLFFLEKILWNFFWKKWFRPNVTSWRANARGRNEQVKEPWHWWRKVGTLKLSNSLQFRTSHSCRHLHGLKWRLKIRVVPAARKHALNAVQVLLSFETYKQFNRI